MAKLVEASEQGLLSAVLNRSRPDQDRWTLQSAVVNAPYVLCSVNTHGVRQRFWIVGTGSQIGPARFCRPSTQDALYLYMLALQSQKIHLAADLLQFDCLKFRYSYQSGYDLHDAQAVHLRHQAMCWVSASC